MGDRVRNVRMSLRQGDRPSGTWFCYGIDPLLAFLDKRLLGIPSYTLPVLGPTDENVIMPLPPFETRYKVFGYLDDVKPAITCMAEFNLVDQASLMFENASGCRLHRSANIDKCKFLSLSRWKGTLQQEDIPLPYLKLSDYLDFLGCKLYATYST